MIAGGGVYVGWTVTVPPSGPAPGTVPIVPPATQLSFLGYGLTTPFRRGMANDFAAAGGPDLVKSRISQIAGTAAGSSQDAGELPWRGEFGIRLKHLRHRSKTVFLEKKALHYVLSGLAQWEPCARVATVKILSAPKSRALTIRVIYDIVTTNPAGNQVVTPGQTLDVPLDAAANPPS